MSSTTTNLAIAAAGVVFLFIPIPPITTIIGAALIAYAIYRQFVKDSG